MYRRRVLLGARGSTPVVRVQRTRLVKGYATEIPPSATGTLPPPPPPKKKRGFFRRTLLYTSIFAGTFYGGSTLVALKSDRYHDFFVESVPGGEALMEIATEQGWDKVPISSIPQKTIDATKDTYHKLESTVNSVIGSSSSEKGSDQPSFANQVKDRARRAGAAIITKVERNPSAPDFSQVGKTVQGKAFQFSEGVSELAKEVESALRGVHKPSDIGKAIERAAGAGEKKAPVPTSPDAARPRDVEAIPPPYDAEWVPPKGMKVYTGPPLPIGFEPPPGYVLPPTAKPKEPKKEAKADVLPLLAPNLKPELSASEPVIAQLAGTIDSLAALVQANPTALSGAQSVLSTAQVDLDKLGERLNTAKAEERAKLEKQLEARTKEYEDKLLGLEMESKERLDKQEEDWKGVFEDERRKIIAAYREKLTKELETQSEIINQRLKEEVIAQGIELQRRWIRDIKVRVESERGGRLAKLDELATGLKKLERTTADNAAYIDENVRVHGLWSALRAVVHTALENPERTPFRDELRVLKSVATASASGVTTPEGKAAPDAPIPDKTATKDTDPNSLLAVTLDSLLSSPIPDTGVEPRSDLAAWFNTSVAPAVRKAALVPDTTAGVLSHVASWAFAGLRFSRPTYGTPSSVNGNGNGNDVLSILSRAEYYLSVKNLDAATREVNQLTGWPKRLVKDWLEAARRRLEVEQALDVVQTQATLASLLVL